MHTRNAIRCLFTLSLGFLLPLELLAQQAGGSGDNQLRIRRLEADMVRAPSYQISGGQRSMRSRDWLQVQTQFETRPEWIDELTFTYHIVLRNPRPGPNTPEFVLFRGESAYVNIARTREGQSTVFLHPSTVERFGSVFRVGVVITSQGRVLGMESSPSADGRWWEQLTPREGFVMRRNQTPWAFVNVDDFEAIRPSDR